MPWKNGIFGCCDDTSLCCDVIWCGPCAIGRQCNAVDGQKNSLNTTMCLAAFFCEMLMPLFACQIRRKMDEKFNLDEGCCCSTLSACCFAPCSLCASGRELVFLDHNPGGTCCEPKTAMK